MTLSGPWVSISGVKMKDRESILRQILFLLAVSEQAEGKSINRLGIGFIKSSEIHFGDLPEKQNMVPISNVLPLG